MSDQQNLPVEDDDVEGHKIQPVIHHADQDEDVEGHRVQPVMHKADEDEDDVEGHRMRHDV